MRHLRFGATFLGVGLLGTILLADEEIPLQNASAPLFWKASDQGTPASGLEKHAVTGPATPLPFVAITPCRQYDSRSGPVLTHNTPRTVTIIGAPCAIPSDAQAVGVNITIFNITGAASNGVFKVGITSPPTTAWINYPPTETQRGNAGALPLASDGTIAVQINQGSGSVDFVVDVFGYYSPQGVVNTVNTLSGNITLAGGSNVSITPSGQTLTISNFGTLTGITAGTGIAVSGTAPSPTVLIPPAGILADRIASRQVVKSVNGVNDDVLIAGSGGTSVSTGGNTITISAPSVSMVLGAAGDTTLIGAGYTEIAPNQLNFWTPTTMTGAPSARELHTAVWTGSLMIVWGGYPGGSGSLGDGARYDPVANTWAPMTSKDAPSARYFHTAVWTGSVMIVWGGYGSVSLNDGARYDPVANTWTETNPTGAPPARYMHTAVWTGSRMIVWGGYGVSNSGSRYDPVANTWATTTTSGAPPARYRHSAVWTGSRMIVWGGYSGSAPLNDGSRYDPIGNNWADTTMTNAPPERYNHTAIWTGSRMIVFGGSDDIAYLKSGGQYNPGANTWTTTALPSSLSGRRGHTAVWTGTRMVVWGGKDASAYFGDGSQYDPGSDTWFATTIPGSPSGRYNHTAVWTGSRMIIWGGYGDGSHMNDGAQWTTVSLYMKN